MAQSSGHADSRYKYYTESTVRASGHRTVIAVRSFAAFERDDVDDDNDDGASIPDILGRCSSLGTSIAEEVASPVTFRKILAGTEHLASLNGHSSFLSSPELRDAQSAGTRSLSSPTRSSPNQFTESQANSSSSSFAPISSIALPGPQSKGQAEHDILESLGEETNRHSFNLVSANSNAAPQYSLQTRSEALFSTNHLRVIFDNSLLFKRFTDFLSTCRPRSTPVLVYYQDAIKALKVIDYANSITQTLPAIKGLEFSQGSVPYTLNEPLRKKASEAFDTLAREDLPAYITHEWVRVVNAATKKKITDTLPDNLQGLCEGLTESFCLTDPSRADNPIVLASQSFHTMTQYGPDYVMGRNCRFLQGPDTSASSIRRINDHLGAKKEHCETLLNYRRDGSPFLNLVMIAPLFDSQGTVRYHLGAQVDVSCLAKDCIGLRSLRRLVEQERDDNSQNNRESGASQEGEVELYRLAGMLSPRELSIIRQADDENTHLTPEETRGVEAGPSSHGLKARTNVDDIGPKQRNANLMENISASLGKRTPCIYEHYLLIRPHPYLRILFSSPSLRFPGILQSEFMSRVGGTQADREPIVQSFASGASFTAKIRWTTRTDNHGKGRWIHCTPLLGATREIGVWMVILVDDETDATLRQPRLAPPVDLCIGSRQNPFDGNFAGQSGGGSAGKLKEQQNPSFPRLSMKESRSLRGRTSESGNPAPDTAEDGGGSS